MKKCRVSLIPFCHGGILIHMRNIPGNVYRIKPIAIPRGVKLLQNGDSLLSIVVGAVASPPAYIDMMGINTFFVIAAAITHIIFRLEDNKTMLTNIIIGI